MNIADWAIVAILGISSLLSLLRGFTREALSLAAWVLALVGARVLTPSMAVLFVDRIDEPVLREVAAFGLLFIGILLVGMLVAHLAGAAVRHSPLSPADRLLGLAFGIARGVLLVTVLVAFSSPWTGEEEWWQQSRLIPPFALFEEWTRERAYQLAELAGR